MKQNSGASPSIFARHGSHLKSHDMTFFMVVRSQMAAYCPLTRSYRDFQQSLMVPERPSNTFFLTPSFASCREDSIVTADSATATARIIAKIM